MCLRNYIGINKLIEGVILINLDSRPDRLIEANSVLETAGILDLVERLPAITHKHGMVGCSLSHLECVKIAKKRKWKSLLILEDDIILTPKFNECCDNALDQLSLRNWSVFHFGAMLMNICNQVDDNLLRVGYNWAAHAVLIHERVYDFIINKYDPKYDDNNTSNQWGGHYPFDGFVNKDVFDVGYEIYSAYPVLISQRPNHSDTWDCHRDYKDLIEDSYHKQICRDVVVLMFSKNRPLQLHAALESYFRYAKHSGNESVTVLYNCDREYEDGYTTVKRCFPNVSFLKDSNFIYDVERIIKSKRYVLFLVDDMIFHKPFALSDGCEILSSNREVFSMSYRLGSNINYSYINNIHHNPPEEYNNSNDGVVLVDWTNKDEYTDFGYPFEISSSMYRVRDIMDILDGARDLYNNPNYFELCGTIKVRKSTNKYGKYIATYRTGVAVCIPLNRVQNVHLNRCIVNPLYSPKSLLDMYNRGMIINLDTLDENWNTNSVHTELFPNFKYRA